MAHFRVEVLPFKLEGVAELRKHVSVEAFERRQRGLAVLNGMAEKHPGIDRASCLNCRFETVCEFAWDPYNVDGDCLGVK